MKMKEVSLRIALLLRAFPDGIETVGNGHLTRNFLKLVRSEEPITSDTAIPLLLVPKQPKKKKEKGVEPAAPPVVAPEPIVSVKQVVDDSEKRFNELRALTDDAQRKQAIDGEITRFRTERNSSPAVLQKILDPSFAEFVLLPEERRKVLQALRILDPAERKVHFERSGQLAVGLALFDEEKIPEAVVALEKAAEGNDPKALQFLGALYQSKEIKRNDEKAYGYVKRLTQTEWWQHGSAENRDRIRALLLSPLQKNGCLPALYDTIAFALYMEKPKDRAEDLLAIKKALYDLERGAVGAKDRSHESKIFDSNVITAVAELPASSRLLMLDTLSYGMGLRLNRHMKGVSVLTETALNQACLVVVLLKDTLMEHIESCL
ncbi:MAG TPA: hypothetical protein VIJ14_06050, partial [Rhabdochlamydiaceae bacterium]